MFSNIFHSQEKHKGEEKKEIHRYIEIGEDYGNKFNLYRYYSAPFIHSFTMLIWYLWGRRAKYIQMLSK